MSQKGRVANTSTKKLSPVYWANLILTVTCRLVINIYLAILFYQAAGVIIASSPQFIRDHLLPVLLIYYVLIYTGLAFSFGIVAAADDRKRQILADLSKHEQERFVKLEAEREERFAALASADPAVKYIVSLLDKERESQQEELQTLRSMIKPRPFVGFLTNFIWALLGIVGGILASKFFH